MLKDLTEMQAAVFAGPLLPEATELSGLAWSNATSSWWAVSSIASSDSRDQSASYNAVLYEFKKAQFAAATVLRTIALPQSTDPEGIVWLQGQMFAAVDEVDRTILVLRVPPKAPSAGYGSPSLVDAIASIQVCI